MISYDFQTTTHGKWILAGEHAVLRGGAALVFPIHEKQLIFHYQKTLTPLQIHYDGSTQTDTASLFFDLLGFAKTICPLLPKNLTGNIIIQNTIPIGVGLGASAALCVAISRWFVHNQWLEKEAVSSFAKRLENFFHGQSSGLDIAGVAAQSAILFKAGTYSPIKQAWSPHFSLSSCGHVGDTASCIKKVQSLWQENAALASQIDEKMQNAVHLSLHALSKWDGNSLPALSDAMNQATACFEAWGLVDKLLDNHMQNIKTAGALAVKPTGSGGGGYVVSLWVSPPPQEPVP